MIDYAGMAALLLAFGVLLGNIGAFLKIMSELRDLHKTVNSLADKRVSEANAAGVDRGSIEERERADKRDLASKPLAVTIVPADEPLPVDVVPPEK